MPLRLRLHCLCLAVIAACSAGSAAAQAPAAAAPPQATYWIYVGAESADMMHRVRFGPEGVAVEKTSGVGLIPTETEGPHGLAVSPDGRFVFVTTGHGNPEGMLWKYALGADTLIGRPLTLGLFPASMDLTPDGQYAFIVNFNLHGDMVPSSVSVVYTPDMIEVARIDTCTMPHGSRINAQGTLQYSTCMMDDQLVEIDTRTFAVKRRFSLAKGKEAALAPAPASAHAQHAQHGAPGRMTHNPSCSPTWAQPSANGARIFVACNKSDEVLEIDTRGWKLARRIVTGRGPYNLAATPDGRLLVVTLKQGAGVQIVDLTTGAVRATVPTSTKVVHGVVVSPDSRYAFVSVEGIGAEPGKVDIIDLQAGERVASAEVGQQASGIAFYRMEKH